MSKLNSFPLYCAWQVRGKKVKIEKKKKSKVHTKQCFQRKLKLEYSYPLLRI